MGQNFLHEQRANCTAENRIRVAHLIYSPKVGGSEMLAAEICSRLDRSLFAPICIMLFPGSGQMPNILGERGIPCANLRRSRITRLLGPFFPAFSLSRMKIDILHVHHVPFFLSIFSAARLAGIRCVCLTEHSKLSISKSWQLQEGSRLAARKAGFFSVVSQNLKDYLVREVNIPESRITVIRNGVDTSRFSPENSNGIIREFLPEGFNGKIILSVGRLAEVKDHRNLISALALLKGKGRDDFHLVLVGDGELRGTIEEQVKTNGLYQHVTFAGTRTDVDRLLPGADLFVMSSKSEGLPMSILEAMACGLPVVSTNVGGVSEIIEDGKSGTLVPPGDPVPLAAEISRILNNSELGKQLGCNARKRAERYLSSDKMVRDYSALYLSL